MFLGDVFRSQINKNNSKNKNNNSKTQEYLIPFGQNIPKFIVFKSK